MNNQTIGLKIKQIRESMRLTREKLAEKTGVCKSRITKYESGVTNIPVDHLVKLANGLNTDISTFFEPIEIKLEGIASLTEEEKAFIDLLRKLDNKRLRFSFLKMLRWCASVGNKVANEL